MSKSHFPGANTTAQYWAGKFVGSSMNTNCVCLHTTEGFTWPAYGGGASAPHMTILPNIKAKTVSIRQHFPAGKSSRALVNLSGGVETNTLNVFQIELIGTCDSRYRERWGSKRAGVDYVYWPDAPQWLLEAIAPVFRWLDAEWPNFKVADATPRGWTRYPESYGLRANQRMTFAEWRNAYGIFGHQHVPENTHGDPGNFPIAKLIAAIKGTSEPATPKPPTSPKPSPKPPTAPDTKGDVLTLNVASLKFSFAKRAPKIAAYILEQDRDFVYLQECYAAVRPLIQKRITKNYALVGVKGGRVIYARRGRWSKVGAAKGYRLGRNRKQAVAVKLRNLETGAVVNAVNAHLSYKAGERAQRREETDQLCRFVNRDFPTGYDLYGGDWNWPRNYYLGDDIADVWEKYGLADAGVQVGVDNIVNRDWNTYNGNAKPGPKQNLHIDRFASKGLLKFTKLIVRAPEPHLSDHYAVIGEFTVPTN